jgi:hypothetical protein
VTFAEAGRLLRTSALARAVDEPDCADRIAPLLDGRFALRPRTVDLAVDATIREAAHDLLTRGWRPTEVYAFAAKRLDAAALSYLGDALAATTQWTVSPPWLRDLRQLGAVVWWSSARPHAEQWAERSGAGRAATLRVAIDVLALLAYLPRTDHRQPGMPPAIDAPGDTLVDDEKLAGKIDALLTRAGRSEYDDEALACATKAQDLLLRHAAARPVREQVLADPRRLAAAVGGELATLLQRAVSILARRPRPRPELPAAGRREAP